MAGHGGKPFILASTRSPTFHCAATAAAAAAAAAAAPRFFRAGGIADLTLDRHRRSEGASVAASATGGSAAGCWGARRRRVQTS
uniref:Uncharacterized protein n=1 Tax=Arundo donax TaxID=35708 RepID=A0A0A9FFN1_ARUDO